MLAGQVIIVDLSGKVVKGSRPVRREGEFSEETGATPVKFFR